MGTESASDTEVVAYLFAVEGRKPDEIEGMLGISATTVWRHLKLALGDGPKPGKAILKELAPILDVSNRDRDRIRAVAHERTAKARYAEITDRVKAANPWRADEPHPLKAVSVFKSTDTKSSAVDSSEAWEQAVWKFGTARPTAACVVELLRPARRIGVAWGRTLYSVTQGITKLSPKPRSGPSRAAVFPVNGHVLADVPGEDVSTVFPEQTKLSPSYLAEQVALALNGTAHGTPSLNAVSAVVPRRYFMRRFKEQSERRSKAISGADVVRQFVSEIADYARVFGNESGDRHGTTVPLIDEADALLVAVGSSSFPRFWSRAMADYLNTPVETIRALTYGDIGAALVPREKLDAKQRDAFREIDECFTGIRLRHIRQCASKAQAETTNAPGVIAFGVGRHLGRVVAECIRLGLVNHLVIDEDLAKFLREHPDGRDSDDESSSPKSR